MGHLRSKYTRAYFLRASHPGEAVAFGGEGIEDFRRGEIRSHSRNILKRLDFRGRSVLDIGFGRGESIKYALEHGARKVTGVDFSEAACTIALDWLRRYNLSADLYDEDILDFLTTNHRAVSGERFDIVLMLDVVEHIPRVELVKIFLGLHDWLTGRSVVVIQTPVFRVDNDVIREGLKPEAHDTSDDFPQTSGMHCNRYTRQSLQRSMQRCGFTALSGHFFVLKSNFLNLRPSVLAWLIAAVRGYPVSSFAAFCRERFEYAFWRPPSAAVKLRSVTKRLVKGISPPFLYAGIKRISGRGKTSDNNQPVVYNPTWHQIQGGLLRGRSIFLDPRDGLWQREIIEGSYDQYFIDYVSQCQLRGKVIFDIGAHIGYHSMIFSRLVEAKGKVFSFEPNRSNLERMRFILARNQDLAARIKIFNVAISDQGGEVELHYREEVDDGRSSGSYISGAYPPLTKNNYQRLGFLTAKVKAVTLDQLTEVSGIRVEPALIKIDVEGVEHLVLRGALHLIRKYRPIILVEVHSIAAMYYVQNFFRSENYAVQLLNLSPGDGRCFLAGCP